jgi:hypothetical protein
MLRRHLDGLLIYSKYHVTSATAEVFISVMQLIKKMPENLKASKITE